MVRSTALFSTSSMYQAHSHQETGKPYSSLQNSHTLYGVIVCLESELGNILKKYSIHFT